MTFKEESAASLKQIRSEELRAAIIAALTEGLERLDGGKNWAKGNFAFNGDNRIVFIDQTEEYKKACKFCAVGAVYISNPEGLQYVGITPGFEAVQYAERALTAALPDGYKSAPNYNDQPSRTFADIEALYNRAIELVKGVELVTA